MVDFYKILGVAQTATSDEIKAAFRNLAKQHHPDVGGDSSKFKLINEAYSILGDEKKRKDYDDSRAAPFRGPSWNPASPEDFFHFARNINRRNHNIRTTIQIPLESVIADQQITLRVNTGKGLKEVLVHIPKGVHSGAIISYKKLGYEAENGPPGDLLIEIIVMEDSRFKRENNHIVSTLTIDSFSAILGTEVEVRTISGKILAMKIPAGTQYGKIFRFPEHGLPDIKTGKFGDHYVQLYISTPTNLSSQEIELLQKIKELREKR